MTYTAMRDGAAIGRIEQAERAAAAKLRAEHMREVQLLDIAHQQRLAALRTPSEATPPLDAVTVYERATAYENAYAVALGQLEGRLASGLAAVQARRDAALRE